MGADDKDRGARREGDFPLPFVPERADKPYRPRHDGFTPERQRKFFRALKKSGCIADACRKAGISRNTVRRWRERWEEFDSKVEAALAIASVELDMIAWQRATEGAEEKVWRDGRLVFTRQKPSDAMLRLLMQGANPEKCGRMGQLPKKTVMKRLRKEAEREARARIGEKLRASKGQLADKILRLLDALDRRERARAIAEGCTLGPDGRPMPPGWRAVRDLPALPPPETKDETR